MSFKEIREALQVAKGVFTRYSNYHLDKGDEVSLEKAYRNELYSNKMHKALAKLDELEK